MGIKAKRIAPGIYDVNHNGIKYELERDEWGIWVLYDATNLEWHGREYCQDFHTKRDALHAIEFDD